jgi:hypothetical protein
MDDADRGVSAIRRNVLQNAIQVPQSGYRQGYSAQPALGASAIPDPKMVIELQRMLNDLGYDAGPPDGGFGPANRAGADQLRA